MALVSVEKLKKHFLEKANSETKKGNLSVAKGCLYCHDYVANKVKPVDPVRHGHWIKIHPECCRCSVCGEDVVIDFDNIWNYCPCCGAQMGGKCQ